MSETVKDEIITPPDRKQFSSTIDPGLHNAAKIYCIKEGIKTFSDLLDRALRKEIGYGAEEEQQPENEVSETIFDKE